MTIDVMHSYEHIPHVLKMEPCILLQSGFYFDFLHPEHNVYTIEDIAHGLSHICRFTGHVAQFYSVAQHSVLVARNLPPHLRLEGLLHDRIEAYLGDIATPLKQLLPGYKELECAHEKASARVFHLPHELSREVKHMDMVLLATEKRDLMPEHPAKWAILSGVEPLKDKIVPWTPEVARGEFLRMYKELTREAQNV